MAYYRIPTNKEKEDIIKKINNGEITDYDNIEWLSLFKVNGYYDIRTELFDRIDKQYWKPVLKAFVEAVSGSDSIEVINWLKGHYGKVYLKKFEKEVDKQTEQSEPEQKVEPQQIDNRHRSGRKIKDNYSWIIDIENKDSILKELHNKIDHLSNGSTADIVNILKLYEKEGEIKKPTYGQAKKEFPNIGVESGYNHQWEHYNKRPKYE